MQPDYTFVFEKALGNFYLRNFNTLRIVLLVILCIQIFFLLVTFNKWGPIFTTDTINYFALSNDIRRGVFPYSPLLSPGYPLLVFIFSHFFDLDLMVASYWLCLIFYILIFVIIYLIIRSYFGRNHNKLNIIILSLLLINSWTSIKVIFTAHADELLALFHLVILLILIHALKKRNLVLYIICCLLAALAVWVKYNSMIYVPFLAIAPLLFYGWKPIAFVGIVPVVLSGGSFFIFKKINGVVTYALSTPVSSALLWHGDISKDTLFTNLSDAGKVLSGSIFTDIVGNKIPNSISIILFLFISVGFCFYVIKNIGKSNISLVLLSFAFIYTFGVIFILQLNDIIEVDTRTLFLASVTMVLGLFSLIVNEMFKYRYTLIFILAIFQPIRSTAGIFDWYKRAPMDSLKQAKAFGSKSSLKRLNDLIIEMQIEPSQVFSNRHRYLSIHWNYRYVGRAPQKIEFQRGKMLPLDDNSFRKRVESINREILERKAILVLFDDYDNQYVNYVNDSVQIERINSDVIIYKAQ